MLVSQNKTIVTCFRATSLDNNDYLAEYHVGLQMAQLRQVGAPTSRIFIFLLGMIIPCMQYQWTNMMQLARLQIPNSIWFMYNFSFLGDFCM